MSEESGQEDRALAPYEVGYGRPPKEYRFKKGQSGNPRGRVRGSRNRPKVNTEFGMRPAEEFLRQEAYRMVTLREGGELIELPAIQAVFRAMGVSALKGNRFAQRTLTELVTRLESRDAESRFELFGNAMEYKHRWSEAIKAAEEQGRPIPEPLPHPDDIILEPGSGGVRILGPQTPEQKAHYEKAISRREEAQREVSYFARKYRQAQCDATKAQFLEEWHWEQRMFDIINDSLAGRYKAKLKDRSLHPDASKPGETLRQFMEDRQRPTEKRKWSDYVE